MKISIIISILFLWCNPIISQTTFEPTPFNQHISVDWTNNDVFYDGIVVTQDYLYKCRDEVIIHLPFAFTLMLFDAEGRKMYEYHYEASEFPLPGYIIDKQSIIGDFTLSISSPQLTMARLITNN